MSPARCSWSTAARSRGRPSGSFARSRAEMAVLGAERVTIVGAGSLGSVYGGLLARAGHDVQLLAREQHARAVQETGGLRLESGGREELVRLRADWRPERIEPAE